MMKGMRKLGRILRRCLTALSLLLLVAVLAAWVRGYYRLDWWMTAREECDVSSKRTRRVELLVGSGEIGITFVEQEIEYSITLEKQGVRWESIGLSERLTASIMQIRRREIEIGKRYGRQGDFRMIAGMAFGWAEPSARIEFPTRVKSLSSSEHYWIFPCWMAAVVFGGLPSWRFLSWWRSRRRLLALRQGLCPNCGYDLRASPGRCPECGLEVGEKREARSEERGAGRLGGFAE